MRTSRVCLSMVVCVLLLALSSVAFAETWAKTYGGTGSDEASSIQPTADGGYIVAGQTYSFGFGVGVWVLKLDSGGTIQWQKTYSGGIGVDRATSIRPTADGGYIVAGETTSFGTGNWDAWVLKLDSGGTVQWQKTYGGTGYDSAASIQPTADGGYIVAGTTSFGAGGGDAWVLKLDSSGNVTWQKTYGGTGYDSAASIQPTADGGYIVAGTTTSFGAGYGDAWVLKLDSGGTVQWQKTYGGWNLDQAASIQPTADGGYIVAGWTYSFGAGGGDAWVLKLDSGGNITGCAARGTSNATVTDISVTRFDTTVSGAITAVTGSDTGVPPQNTTASTTTVCSASGTFGIENKPPVCSAATASPASLWAPNHQMVPVSILGVTDPDGNAVTITATSVFQDELVKATGTGSGSTSPDATLSPLAVRAERDGTPKAPGAGFTTSTLRLMMVTVARAAAA